MIREAREPKLTGKSGLRKERAQPKGWALFEKSGQSGDLGNSSQTLPLSFSTIPLPLFASRISIIL
jgi:hypothetical protein